MNPGRDHFEVAGGDYMCLNIKVVLVAGRPWGDF